LKIYFYEGYEGGNDESRTLLLYALNDYLSANYIADDILITSKGKPYLSDNKVMFSVSHSKILWIVAISDKRIGADIEVKKEKDKNKIANKVFSENEKKYIDLWGEYGFYILWTRREALIKTLGLTVFNKMPDLVDTKHDLIDCININGNTYYFKDIEISDEVFCSICTEKADIELEIEMIN